MSELPLFPFVLREAGEDDPVAIAFRQRAPLVRARTEEGTAAWVALTYETARQAVTDPRLSRPAAFEPEAPKTTPAQATAEMLPKLDKEDHTRVRRRMSKALSPAAQERQRPAIRVLVDKLLDGFTTEPLDLLAHFLTPLPVIVICQLFGAPEKDWDPFVTWADHIQQTTSFTAVEIMESAAELEKYGYDLIKLKRAQPGEDLTTDLIRIADYTGALSDGEIVQNLLLILVAANDASLKEMAVCLTALLKRPQHYQWLVAHPEAVPTAVEELIRFSRLSRSGLPIRIAMEDVVIGGQLIRKGEGVIPLHHLAHRDPSVFTEPDTLDLTRPEASRHLGFGGGAHYCTGAPLARVMMQEALGGLIRRFPTLRLAVPWEQLEWQEGGLLRDPVAEFWSSGEGVVQAGEVAGSGPVQGVAVPPGVQSDQVQRDGGVHVLQMGFLLPAVAGVPYPGDGDGLADGALGSGPECVAGLPVRGGLLRAGGLQGLVDLSGPDRELAALFPGGGALVPDRARPAGGGGEGDDDRVGAALGDRVPGGAGLALRAGGLLAVEVEGER